MNRFAVLALAVLLMLVCGPAFAHEMRPAYLDMREVAPEKFDVVWKVPAKGDLRLGLYIRLPANCESAMAPSKAIEGNAYVERWTAFCPGGLTGREIAVDGLSATLTDALIRIAYANETMEVTRLKPDVPSYVVAGVQTGFDVAITYFRLGVDHILSGADHLLFVLALMLLIGRVFNSGEDHYGFHARA